MSTALKLIKECQKAEADAGTWTSLWQDLADYVMPRKSEVTETKTQDVEGWTDSIYDTEAIHDCLVLAAGQMDYLVQGKWFEFEPPDPYAPTNVKNWYKRCGEQTLDLLMGSNFHMVIHEFFHDRAGFGTSHMHIEEDADDIVYFTNASVGTYFIRENHKGMVDTVYRKFKLASDKAVLRWGEENLGKVVLEDYRNGEKTGTFKDFEFWHIVKPRLPGERETGKIDGVNMPIKSVYVATLDKKTVSESGYNEMPCVVSRFLKWGDQPYGYCPSVEALPAIKQKNFIERQMDALAEVSAFPRVLVPSDLEEDPDLRSGGVTVFDPNNPQAKPQEWLTGGRYDIGKDRSNDKGELIKRAYHVDLFQMLTQYDELRREKTAYEVSQMLAEKITRISPTFERLKHEVFKPVLTRMFTIQFRKGMFAQPPDEVVVETVEGSVIPTPKVHYTSKLAMAIKSLENQAFMQFMGMIEPLAEAYGSAVLNQINPERSTRILGDNQGVPVDFFNTEDERKELEQLQAKQAQAAQAMETAERGAKAFKDAGPEGMQLLEGGM